MPTAAASWMLQEEANQDCLVAACSMNQHPHITGRNVNASVPRSVLRECVLQRPNNVAEIGIGVVLQFNVLENHYGAISTSTAVLRDHELLPVTQVMKEHTERSWSWKTRWHRGMRDERTFGHFRYIAGQRKGPSYSGGCR